MSPSTPLERSARLRCVLKGVADRHIRICQTIAGCRTVLLVEDARRVRAVTQRVLQSLGHVVIAARNAEHALRVIECWDGAIELVIIDVALPPSNGTALADKIRTLSPKTRVLLMSAYSAEIVDDAHRELPFLAKPFTPEMLARSIEAATGSLGGRA